MLFEQIVCLREQKTEKCITLYSKEVEKLLLRKQARWLRQESLRLQLRLWGGGSPGANLSAAVCGVAEHTSRSVEAAPALTPAGDCGAVQGAAAGVGDQKNREELRC